MTASHDKLACGDQVRVTFKGAVIEASPNGRLVLQAHNDGTTGQYEPVIFSWSERQSSDFQIERIEPPLKVGSRVRDRVSGKEGRVIGVDATEAWVRLDGLNHALTYTADMLERIA